MLFFFFNQKTAYELRISDWGSDVCSSDLARFQACVEVGREHGLGRIEVANLPMAAMTATWCGDVERANATALEAIEAARQVGHGRAEMIAHHVVFLCRRSSGDEREARRHAEAGTEIARRLGARRFEAEGMLWEDRKSTSLNSSQ